MKRLSTFKMVVVVLVAVSPFAFSSGSQEMGVAESDEEVLVGVSFADFATERWPVEDELMRELVEERGASYISQVANHDPKVQNDQIDNMILQGADVIIVVAEDGDAAATAVDSAARDGVPIISYDRLIKSPEIAAYVSFDNVEIGRAQARGILEEQDEGKFVLMGGSPTDNAAVLVRQGQMEVLQPYIDRGDIEIVADQWVENWDPANAVRIMENILTATSNDIDAVVASNDGTALGALQALEAQGLAGEVPISGQDATLAGAKSIVAGDLTMTVFNDVRLLAPTAIDLAFQFAKGETPDGLEEYSLYELSLDESVEGAGTVDAKFLPVVQVDRGNLYETVVESCYQPYDEVYADIPEDERPERPDCSE